MAVEAAAADREGGAVLTVANCSAGVPHTRQTTGWPRRRPLRGSSSPQWRQMRPAFTPGSAETEEGGGGVAAGFEAFGGGGGASLRVSLRGTSHMTPQSGH